MPRVRISFAIVAALAIALIGCAHLNRGDPASFALERSSAVRAAPESGELTIATFNVHMERPKTLIAAIVSDPSLRDADVLLLQEIQWHGSEARSDAAAVAHALGMHHVYAPGYGLARGGSHGIAMLSRYELTAPQALELPRNHTVVNSARRVALAATIEARDGPVRIWNVHLDNRINPERRLAQLQPVLSAIDRERARRVILAGDLNTSPFCWVGHLLPVPCGLQARPIERAVRARGFALPTKNAGATHKYIGMRLDAIYVRGLVTDEVSVGTTRISDHFPLVARMR